MKQNGCGAAEGHGGNENKANQHPVNQSVGRSVYCLCAAYLVIRKGQATGIIMMTSLIAHDENEVDG